MRRSIASASPRRRYRGDYAVPVVFLGLSAFFLVLTLVQLTSTALMFARTVPLTGSYAGSVVHAGGSHGGMFSYPRFNYRTPAGTIRTVTARAGSTGESYADGETVSLRYRADRPDDTVVASFPTLWTGPLVCTGFAAAFGVPGLFILRALRRRPPAGCAD